MHRVVMSLLLAAGIPLMAAQPRVGDRAPGFSLQSLGGKTVQLSDVNAKGPVVLLVLRGYPGYQCPICNRQVQEFLRNAKGLADAGAQVVMVYPGPAQDLTAHAEEFAADKQFPDNFRFLMDPDYKFTNLYGLRWDAPKETAYPSTFLINKRGVVFFAKISDSHGGRTTAAEVIDLVNKERAGK